MLLKKWEELPDDLRCAEVRRYYDILVSRKADLIRKRVFDIAASFLLILLLSPVFFLIAAAIAVDSKGCVFFRQIRVTACGKQFRILKFRTMRTDAEALGAQITANNDTRITRIGKYLRRCRLDEIPQLFHVLRGEMTFVGTRPEVLRYVDRYTASMKATLLLPAGITSEASIYYREESRLLDQSADIDRTYIEKILPGKMEYNLKAMEQFSFWNDLKILLKTVLCVFVKKYDHGREAVKREERLPMIAFCAVSSEDLYKSRKELIQLFIDRGYEILLLSPEPFCCSKYFKGNKISRYSIPMRRTGVNPLADIKTYLALRRAAKKWKPDMMYSFSGAKAVIYATLAAAASKSVLSFCMINGLGSIYRINTLKNKMIRIVMDALYAISLKRSEWVFFQNDDDRDVFIRHKLIARDRCSVIHGAGVNLADFPKTDLPGRPVCLFAGRLLTDKGIREYVAAARIVRQTEPDAKFVVVGPMDSNPMAITEKELNEWVREGTIEYLGKRNDMYEIYSQCRVFILPSYHEGTPRTVLEAMAVGRPIITTNAPGCRETVINGYNGFCVAVGACDEIACCVHKLLKNNDLCQRMAAASRQIAEAKYDVNLINNTIFDCIDHMKLQVVDETPEQGFK